MKNQKKANQLKLSLIVSLVLLSNCSGQRPSSLGLDEKSQLRACPSSPNCVISVEHEGQRPETKLDPIKLNMPKEIALENAKKILTSMKGAQIITQTNDYIHAEFTSSLFKFVDDLELSFKEEGLIHFRSASRLGYSDLGANKERIELFRFRFYQNDI